MAKQYQLVRVSDVGEHKGDTNILLPADGWQDRHPIIEMGNSILIDFKGDVYGIIEREKPADSCKATNFRQEEGVESQYQVCKGKETPKRNGWKDSLDFVSDDSTVFIRQRKVGPWFQSMIKGGR